MKAILIISSLPDILFVWEDKEFARHINQVLFQAGFIDDGRDMSTLDHGAMAQYFSPMIASLTYMNDVGNPYSSITCKDGTIFIFEQYNGMTFMAINGGKDESEDFLKRKLTVLQRLAVMHYGAALELLKVEVPSARKRAWQSLGHLIDAWHLLYTKQQSFLVEAIERIQVNQSLSEMAVSLLQDAVMATAKNKSEQNAVHALLLVNAKLFALYSSRNASELQAADILMITVIVQKIFPHCSLAIPASSPRAPPPLTNCVVSGGPSMSHDMLNGTVPEPHHHASSTPIAINGARDPDRQSTSSSNEDKFYSPPSTPTKDLLKAVTDEAFYSPNVNSPMMSEVISAPEQAASSESDDKSPEESKEVKSDYFKQLIFLNTSRCPYTPHMLHLVHIAAGTVLVLVNEVKYSSIAVSIYQALSVISQLESDDRKATPQQANSTIERLEISIRKIIETLKNAMGTALDNRLRKVRDSWKMVKRSDLYGFLTSQAHELPPGLDAAVNEMIRSLKSLFSVLFLTGSYNDGASNDRHIQTICQIRDNIRTRLSDYEDYLQVKGERNITMTAYLEDYPGLVHFIHVDRSGNQVTAPSLNTSQEQESNPRDPCHVIKQKIWDSWNVVNVFLLQGNTFIALRDGDFLYTYCLWFEDTSGNPATVQSSLPVLPGSPPPGTLSGDNSFYKNLIKRCFPAAQEGTIRCYELMCMHVGLVPIRLAAKHIRRLATALFESSLGAHYPISLLQ